MQDLTLNFPAFELKGERWAEFDLEAGRWDIPLERMKMKTLRIVPPSTQALQCDCVRWTLEMIGFETKSLGPVI